MGGRRSAHWHTFARLSCAASYVNIESASSWSAGHACIQACSCSARAHLSARIRAGTGKLALGAIDSGEHDDVETHIACRHKHVHGFMLHGSCSAT